MYDIDYNNIIYLLRGKALAEFIKGDTLSIANYVAEFPGRNTEGALDVIGILEFLNKLVENLARLLCLETDQ